MVASAHVDTFAADNLPSRDLWPELHLDQAEFQYPARVNCAVEFLDRQIEAGRGDSTCLFGPDRRVSYRELEAEVNRIANVLVDRFGLQPGNRVLLRSANSIVFVACYLAVMKAGGIVVATMPLLRATEIAFPLNKARISIALCDAELAEEMEAARPLAPDLEHLVYWNTACAGSLDTLAAAASAVFAPCPTAADDVCLIAFTSGTTGEPKGTMHFHRDMLAICDGYARHIVRASGTDVFICTAPLAFHVRARGRALSHARRRRGHFGAARDAGRTRGGDCPVPRHDLLHRADGVPQDAGDRARPLVAEALHLRRGGPVAHHLRGLARQDRTAADRRDRRHRNAAYLHQRERGRSAARCHR